MRNRRIFIARPRLDCSFKKGVVPENPGPPLNDLLYNFGNFIDHIAEYHIGQQDYVESETRPLWEFELEEMQHISSKFDVVYFPHRLKVQFPIGENALYYKKCSSA